MVTTSRDGLSHAYDTEDPMGTGEKASISPSELGVGAFVGSAKSMTTWSVAAQPPVPLLSTATALLMRGPGMLTKAETESDA